VRGCPQDWLRVTPKKGANVFVNFFHLLESMGSSHLPSVGLGVAALVALVALKKYPRTSKLPGALIVMIVFLGIMALDHYVSSRPGLLLACPSCACFLMTEIVARVADVVLPTGGVETHAGVKIIGNVDMTFPAPVFPSFSEMGAVVETALFAMFVGFIESIAVAKMYALANSYEIDPSQELVALGAANVVGSVFQTIPAMAGFGMSAINASAGAKSQLSLLVWNGLVCTSGPSGSLLPRCGWNRSVAAWLASLSLPSRKSFTTFPMLCCLPSLSCLYPN
jgi:MFS superfamily sulfate permease-like transporter